MNRFCILIDSDFNTLAKKNMARYSTKDLDGIYFCTFGTVNGNHVFTKRQYFDVLTESLQFCQERKKLLVFAWCIMTNHVHFLLKSEGRKTVGEIIGDFKKYTSTTLIKMIKEDDNEIRRRHLLEEFREAGKKNPNNTHFQFWEQDSHPVDCYSNYFIDQKVDYIHYNPVEAGFCEEPEHYLYSSAKAFVGEPGIIKLSEL